MPPPVITEGAILQAYTQCGVESRGQRITALRSVPERAGPQTYFIGFEDIYGGNVTEGYGDFNDAIFRLQTTSFTPRGDRESAVPEPGTFSVLGRDWSGWAASARRKIIC